MDRKIKIGDTIKIKNDTIDPEFGMDVGGMNAFFNANRKCGEYQNGEFVKKLD